MRLKKEIEKADRDKKIMICLLASILIILLAMPAFAANEAGAEEETGMEESIQTEEVTAEEDEDAGKDDTESSPEDPITGEDGSEDSGENEKEPEKTPLLRQEPVKLKASGDEKVSYTAKRWGSNAGETTVFKVNYDGKTYTGACAEQGVQMSTSGSAAISKISNTKKIAKVVYHYAIELGDKNWWTSSHRLDKVGKILGMEHSYDTDVTKRRMVECFCQIYNMGSSSWYNTVTSSSGGGWSTNTADKVRAYYRDLDTSGITVPDGFEIWFGKSANSKQPFIMWTYTSDASVGFVTMNKVSGNPAITD
jgi:hypothetical protein